MTRTVFEKVLVKKFTRLVKICFCNFSRFKVVAQAVFFGACTHARHLLPNTPQVL